MRSALLLLHEKTGEFFNGSGLTHVDNSVASKEIGKFNRSESVETAYSQGWILIEAAADHLYALTNLVAEPVASIAPYTCVRAVIETSAISAWLLDPEIHVRERVQRSLAFRYEGLRQQLKFLRAANLEDESIKNAKNRIDETETLAIQIGFEPIRNQKNKRIGIGQIMPSVTEIIKTVLQEEDTYRLLSAVTHAHHWALRQLSFTLSRLDGKPILEKSLSPAMVALLCYKSALSFARPCLYVTQLYGWNMEMMIDILDSVSDEIGIRATHRFWKSNIT